MSKRYIYSLCLMLFVAISLTSCLKDDSSSVTYSDDVAITGFTLTTVNTYSTSTDASGNTKTVKTVLASKPVFLIDHYANTIYNPVALPSNCDLKHVLVSITTKNSGQLAIKSMVSDTLTAYNSTDSIDFSQPRSLIVFALDGSATRTYEVAFNVETGSSQEVEWIEVDATVEKGPQALYQNTLIDKTENGFRLSADSGETWTEELIADGENPELLPTECIGYAKIPYLPSVEAEYELMAGALDENGGRTVWRKIQETSPEAAPSRWIHMPELDSEHELPFEGDVSIVWFNDKIYAVQSTGILYKTRDWGRTWELSPDFEIPFVGNDGIKAATDDDGHLWIRDLETERVWMSY